MAENPSADGTETSRSPSTSLGPGTCYLDPQAAAQAGKRHLGLLQYVVFPDHDAAGPPVKRRRLVDRVENRNAVQPIPSSRPAFFVIREAVGGTRPTPACVSYRVQQPPSLVNKMLTSRPSGASRGRSPRTGRISSGLPATPSNKTEGASPQHEPNVLDDNSAADMIERRFRTPTRRHSKLERILRTLIHPKSPASDFALDDAALAAIFTTANLVFFDGALTGRVVWAWSDASNDGHYRDVLGTTAVRAARAGGYETRVVLSRPLLLPWRRRNNNNNDDGVRYYCHYHDYDSRRLLISTFLHELVHCYLFVRCGPRAAEGACGGHTRGFRRIAELIDGWAGPGTLFLADVEADLARFRRDDAGWMEGFEDRRAGPRCSA